ncbi:unnamed protein product [Blepharisma stoltei]|uniref:Cyclic nucleotide-binding domain-containing protein n=1 Tax=Blepharisma stoltei TaxID=1481888 RepID=A0AAU9JQS0_9CILI|nr:unnamed protein product [Blepharisma stoltei]
MTENSYDDLDKLIEAVIHICSKKPNERTQSELSKLMEMTKHAKVFKQLIESKGEIAHNTCCRFLLHECCEAGEYLFRFGDKGTKFYIIIKGKVGIEIPIKQEDTGESVFVEVVQLGNGAAFGELALENSKPRAASVKCKVQTHFVVLEKSDYDHMISKLVREKRNQLVNFLHALPIFNKSTKGTLSKLTYNFKEKNYIKNQVVYREGEDADSVYLIRQGEFAFYKRITVERGLSRYPKEIKSLNKDYSHQSQISILGVGELFGEEDVLNNNVRSSTCICISPSALALQIGKNDFLKRIRGEDSWSAIRSRSTDKVKNIEERVNMLTFIEEELKGSLTPRRKRKREKEQEKLLKSEEIKKSPLKKSETIIKLEENKKSPLKKIEALMVNQVFCRRKESSNSLLYKMVEQELKLKPQILSQTGVVGNVKNKEINLPRFSRTIDVEKYIPRVKKNPFMKNKFEIDLFQDGLPIYEHKRSLSALRVVKTERPILIYGLRHISPSSIRAVSPIDSRRGKMSN